ncbi:pentatricopeptide repeat-containing protein At4g39530-like [Zingiber officinale]|uniref:pentatricopeptide repeat-containing protein At4g39530-like n=1 Tax=Zingiber officinale TaxID=94328 RepID=UPI001C4D6FC3|nr:pentatricopeptide repeat-containing protein At4g39530-like [Zingiber officinale]
MPLNLMSSCSYCFSPTRTLFPFLSPSDSPHKSSPPPTLVIRKDKPIEVLQSIASGAEKNLVYYSSRIQSCMDSRSFDAGKSIQAQMEDEGIVPDTFLQMKILMLYAKTSEPSDLVHARKMFDDMPARNSSTWNTMILAYARASDHLEVLQLFSRMHECGAVPDKFTFPSVIKACLALEAEGGIQLLHGLIIKHGFGRDVVVGTALVDVYANLGCLEDAETAFSEVDGVNVVTWNAIISGYVGALSWEEAWNSFHRMQEDASVCPSHSTLSLAARTCGALRSPDRGRQVHAKAMALGYDSDVFVQNSLIDMYGECGDLEGCELVFHLIKERSQVSWNSIVSSYVRLRYYEEALHMLLRMQQAGYQYDRFNLGSALTSCAALADLETGRAIHGYLVRRLLDSDVVLGSAIIDMYGKCGCMREAHWVFNKLRKRNIVSWNSLMAGFVLEEATEVVIELYHQMELANINPDQFTLGALLSLFANQGNTDLGKQIHASIIRKITRPNLVLETELTHMYARCGRLRDAHNVFNRMPKKNAYSWNSFIEGCLKCNKAMEALRIFRKMQFNGVVPDSFSLSSALTAISHLSTLQKGKEIHGFAVKKMLIDHDVTLCILIDMYAKCGCMDYAYRMYERAPKKGLILNNIMISAFISHEKISDARRIFDKMEEKNIICWNSMLIGYAKGGFGREALQLFQEFTVERGDYECSTLVPIFNLCASLPSAEFGKQLHALATKLPGNSVVLDSAIVDMYAKCGLIEEAREFFNRMKERTILTWNTIISSYSKHGQIEAVFSLYKQMLSEGILPNDITFLCILSACSHTGLLEEGLDIFVSMSEDYGVEPRLEHYNCMVDLLGRAGLLNDAKEMILRMPMEPDKSTWAALLGASRNHIDIDIGRFAAERLFELDPANSGHYRLMANLYASAGRWKEADKMWKLMKERRAMSEPASSWIEIGNQIQVFHAGDLKKLMPLSGSSTQVFFP